MHQGNGPSAVMYIPSVPLTAQNAEYVRDMRDNFLVGRPAPDFPGGVGESEFTGRGMPEDIISESGKTAMGLAPFFLEGNLTPGEKAVRQQACVFLFSGERGELISCRNEIFGF